MFDLMFTWTWIWSISTAFVLIANIMKLYIFSTGYKSYDITKYNKTRLFARRFWCNTKTCTIIVQHYSNHCRRDKTNIIKISFLWGIFSGFTRRFRFFNQLIYFTTIVCSTDFHRSKQSEKWRGIKTELLTYGWTWPSVCELSVFTACCCSCCCSCCGSWLLFGDSLEPGVAEFVGFDGCCEFGFDFDGKSPMPMSLDLRDKFAYT